MRREVTPVDELWVCHLGHVPYSDGVAIQETLRERRIAGELPDTLLLLEHPPVYTRGRRASADDLPFPEDFYRAKGIDIASTDRGGKLTYHGPGQLVGYPIMAIDDVGRYLRTMEDAIVAALAEQCIAARSRAAEGIDYTGVWVDDRKIASIGVHVSRGVATHGFAVNVDVDLEPFSSVVACGLPEVQMTSIAAELERPRERRAGRESADHEPAVRGSGLACFRKHVAYRFCLAHGRRQRLVSPTRLGLAAPPTVSGAPAGAEPIKTRSTASIEAVLA
ncbi:MAG TPA: lipoyl(octanoyl) transferase LipB [Solirubrobacteraceae bacterium]|jgi:lipoyl(octanoyl) transferase|nr:lipoyl(octanoyl) transferase LipB [Solirubrobacteraceae bacterium]